MTMKNPMTKPEVCSKVARLLFAYIDGELSPKDQCFVDEHMDKCAGCFSGAEKERLVKRVVAEEKNAMPDALRGRVLKLLDQEQETAILPLQRRSMPLARFGAWGLAAAASLLLFAGAFYLMRGTHSMTPPNGADAPQTASARTGLLMGEGICVRCYLSGVECPKGKHCPGILMRDGSVWTLLRGPETQNIFADFETFNGQRYQVEGRLFDQAHYVDVTRIHVI